MTSRTHESRRVLLVHADGETRSAYRELLETLGADVLEAAGSRDALERTEAVACDVAVLEVLEPATVTMALADSLRRARPGLPVVLVSSFGEDEELARRAATGDLQVLQAPVSAEALAAAVRDAQRTKPAPAAPRRRSRRGLLLAVAAIAFAVPAVYFLARRPEPPALPDLTATSPVRGLQVRLLSPSENPVSPPRRFAWEAADGAARYRIRIYAPDHEVLWWAETTGTDLPAPVRDVALHPLVDYGWEVEAVDENGAVLRRSQRRLLRISPPTDDPSRSPS